MFCGTTTNTKTFHEVFADGEYLVYLDAYFATCVQAMSEEKHDVIKTLSIPSFSVTRIDMASEFRDTVGRRMQFRRLCFTSTSTCPRNLVSMIGFMFSREFNHFRCTREEAEG
jgi:hypothetical protein